MKYILYRGEWCDFYSPRIAGKDIKFLLSIHCQTTTLRSIVPFSRESKGSSSVADGAEPGRELKRDCLRAGIPARHCRS